MEPNQQSDRPFLKSVAGRLDSWKEIAVYLRRDVRTVQRWHHRAGLPVHRHVDPKQRGVYAFQTELDAWANQYRAKADEPMQPEGPKSPGPSLRGGRALWLMAGTLFCAVTALATWTARPPSATFQERRWVLVAAFDNHTGDEMLDESLQYVLERELSVSSFVGVVPRLRVQDDLRLMRRPDDSRITPALAREVATRDGNIQAIVAGRAEHVGPGYVLTVEILDARTGATLQSRTSQVPTRQALLGGIRGLATWARGAFGETLARSTHDSRLPQVTTASLSALQFYAKAEEALSRNHRQAARVLLESAVREDPDFALAHSLLATVLHNEPDVQAVAPLLKHHSEQALALSGKATEKERLRIVATYHMEHREADKAIAAWEALIRIDPDDCDARDHLAGLYYRLRRIPEAVQELERIATLRPNDFNAEVHAAQAWTLWAAQPERARPYVERARKLWPDLKSTFSAEVGLANSPPAHARDVAWILLFPAYEHWRAGDIKAMLTQVQQVLDSDPLPAGADRDALFTVALSLQMTAGRLRDARGLAERMFQERLRELHLAVVADATDDMPSLRRHMGRVPPEGEQRALRLVRAGLYREAEFVMGRDPSNQGFRETARGELALRRGHLSEAVTDLQLGVSLASAHTLSERYLGAESLASALERLNRKDEALKVLEAAAQAEPRYTLTGPSGAFWLRVLNRLSRAYRGLGRSADADAVDARLRQLLVLADPGHPLVTQLARRGE